MSLPKLTQPIFALTLPSSGKAIRYRQFTVKEEKILLVAQHSGERGDMLQAFKQLITNCSLDPIDIDAMPAFDIEYFFIQLRAKSVSNIVKLTFASTEDDTKRTSVDINLDEVQVHKPTVSNKIVLDEETGVGVVLKYPNFQVIEEMAAMDQTDPNTGTRMFREVIDYIFDKESVYPRADHTPAELDSFIEDFNNAQVQKVQDFLEDMPYVYMDVKYEDENGPQEVRIKGIESFFE